MQHLFNSQVRLCIFQKSVEGGGAQAAKMAQEAKGAQGVSTKLQGPGAQKNRVKRANETNG